MKELFRRFMSLPISVKAAAVGAVLIIVLGVITIPVAALAADERDRQLFLEAAAKEAAAEQRVAAEAAHALAAAKDDAARLNADFAGLTASLGAAVHADAASAFDGARMELALAISSGDIDELRAAVAAVDLAFDDLVASAKGQAEALISASPLAGASRDALTKAVGELTEADDMVAALLRVKDASDAVVAAQKAGAAAAEAAAREKAEAEARAEADAWSGNDWSGGDPTGGGGGPVVDLYDPGMLEMTPGPRGICGDPAGGTTSFDMKWVAREGNTVDILYAYTKGDYQATGGYTLLASGRGSTGTISIPVPCPPWPEPTVYVTVRAVASNSLGSSTAYIWGY